MNKGTLVYPDDIEASEIADRMEIDLTDSEDNDDNVDEVKLECNAGKCLDRSVRDIAEQEFLRVAMEINGIFKEKPMCRWMAS